jgi:hypothetical protein
MNKKIISLIILVIILILFFFLAYSYTPFNKSFLSLASLNTISR